MCNTGGTSLQKLVDVLTLAEVDKKSVPKDEMFYAYTEMARIALAGMTHILANNQERLNAGNKELIDIDHILEICELDEDERLRTADERIEVRKKRRVARAIHNMNNMMKDRGVDCTSLAGKMDDVSKLLYREVTPSEKLYTFRSDRGADIFERITGKKLKANVLSGESTDVTEEPTEVAVGVRTLADVERDGASAKPLNEITDLAEYLADAQKGR